MRTTAAVLAGVVAGVLAFGGVRYLATPPVEHAEPVHYHANFAIYLDGERVRFQDPRYMEDIASCRLDASMVSPRDRVHLHQMIDDVAHAHAAGVTWGHFLANLGYAIGDGVIVDDEGRIFTEGDGDDLTFILNGDHVPSIANLEVVTLDRLLIHHGPADTPADSLEALFADVPSNADAFNESHLDGVGCTGGHVAEETTADRLRRAFWF